MTHEPECPCHGLDYTDAPPGFKMPSCICDELRAAYRRGYNAHARSAQHWQDTHGAYRQHGEGENP